jgi:hypothetical protein
LARWEPPQWRSYVSRSSHFRSREKHCFPYSSYSSSSVAYDEEQSVQNRERAEDRSTQVEAARVGRTTGVGSARAQFARTAARYGKRATRGGGTYASNNRGSCAVAPGPPGPSFKWSSRGARPHGWVSSLQLRHLLLYMLVPLGQRQSRNCQACYRLMSWQPFYHRLVQSLAPCRASKHKLPSTLPVRSGSASNVDAVKRARLHAYSCRRQRRRYDDPWADGFSGRDAQPDSPVSWPSCINQSVEDLSGMCANI